jgi:hypothetical protein
MPLNTIPNKGLTSRGYPSDRLVTPIIINGDMSVAQRGTSETGLRNTGGVYLIDRWAYRRNGTFTTDTFDMSQSTDVPSGQGFVKSLKMDNLSTQSSPPNPTYSAIAQNIEGQNLQMLKKGTSNAESITISFWVKSNKTGTYILEVRDSDNGRTINKSYSINSASTWEKKTISYDGDTSGVLDNDNATSFEVTWFLSASANFTSGTLQTSWGTFTNENRAVGQVNLLDDANNEWYITGVQLEVGEFDSTSIPAFPFESFDNNLRRCYRYYEKSYDYESIPTTNTEVSSMAINGLDQGTKQLRSVPVKHLETKRATPTVTIYDVPGNSGKINTLDSGGTTATNQSFNGVLANGKNSFNWYIGSTDKEGYIYHYTADAEL